MNKGHVIRSLARLSAAALMILAMAGCAPRAPGGRQQTFAVNVMPATRGSLIDYLEVNGDIEASSTIDVYPEKVGEVIGIDVSLGQRVAVGQVIARVDPSRPGQRYVPNPVTAPIAGTITALPVRVGSTVSMSSPIAKISRTNDLVISTNVAERFTAKMKTGLDAVVRLDAFPNETFPAKVTEVSPVVDPVTRSLGIKLSFTGNTDRVKAGMFAEVRIITEIRQNVIRIPFVAVVQKEGLSYVFVAGENQAGAEKGAPAGAETDTPDGAGDPAPTAEPAPGPDVVAIEHVAGTAEKREVVTGLIVDDKVEVMDGVAAGEKVVVAGQKSLDDKASIRIIEELAGYPVQDEISGGDR